MTDRCAWLVSTERLAEQLDDPRVVVVDGSWHLPATGRDGRAEYAAGHIPGAVFFDIDVIADPSSGLPHTMPAATTFAEAMSALGISDRDTIVAYDGAGLYSAGRVWWMLKSMGANDVAVLDGGLPKWIGEGRPLEATPVRRPPARFTPRFNRDAIYDFDQVRAAVGSDEVQIVDVRPAGRFTGEAPEPRPGMRSGHIPGSLNIPLATLLAAGRLRPIDDLKRIFAMAGVDLTKPIVTSCGSGVNAAAVALALDMVGARRVSVYDGSWSEWGGRSDTPIRTGAEAVSSGFD